jgi:hypothetical protein
MLKLSQTFPGSGAVADPDTEDVSLIDTDNAVERGVISSNNRGATDETKAF